MSDVTTTPSNPETDVVQRGSFALTVRRLRRDTASMAALCVILAVILLAIVNLFRRGSVR